MKFKTYTGITWSILELTGLLEDEDSRVCFERYKKHLGLHPFHLTDLNAALNEILSSNLNSYDAELKGFLLAYKNPRLLTPLGDTFYDTCFIHVDVEADFYIFRPEVGCSLKGVVNKKGLTHIGVLVHKAFNVSIPKPDDDENWVGDNIENGQEVRFTVTHLDFSSRLPFIRGALNAETYLQGCKLPDKQNFTCNNRTIFNDNTQDIEETEETEVAMVKPKHKKQRVFFATDSEDSSEEDRVKIKKKILETSTPERSGKTITSPCNDKEAEVKKHVKKSKADKETKVKIINMKTVRESCDTTVNSIIADEESEEDPVSRKLKVQQIINHDPSNETVIDHESKKAQKNLSKKTSKKSSIAEDKHGIVKVKQEKFLAASNGIESPTAKDSSINTVKSSKHPMKQKDYLSKKKINDSTSGLDANESVISPNKKRVKKPMISDSESEDAFVTIKTEKVNDIFTRNNNMEEEVPPSPSKKQPKKRKHSISVPNVEAEMKSPEKASPKKRSRMSDTFDSTSVFQNINIKMEGMSSGSECTQEEDNGSSNKILKKNSRLKQSALNSSNCNVDGDEVKKSKKDEKKQAKGSSITTMKIVPDFGNISVKLEKEDSPAEDKLKKSSKKATSVSNSPKKKLVAYTDDDTDVDATCLQNRITSMKKAKTSGKELKPHSVKIRKEKLTKSELEEKPLKKSMIHHGSTYRLQEDNEKEETLSSRSPNKILHKSKEPESFDFSNVKVKTEKFT